MMLRSMQQAVYSPDNIGHFGLSYGAYAHFTSPIRRYPDLLTHRVIKAILQGKNYHPKGIATSDLNTNLSPAARKMQAKDRAAGKQKAEGDLVIWEALGIHCSANERRADEASRDVEAWLKCYFVRDKLGEEFTGTISGVASFGIFVQLDALFIEGMVHVTDLGADYFQFDDARHELRGERTGMRYQLTDRVTVQVSRVDLDARRIDLRLVTEPGIRTQLKNEARQATGKRDKHEKRDTQGPGKTVKSKAKATKTVSKTAAKNGKKKR
jgi:ribonuclease R